MQRQRERQRARVREKRVRMKSVKGAKRQLPLGKYSSQRDNAFEISEGRERNRCGKKGGSESAVPQEERKR